MPAKRQFCIGTERPRLVRGRCPVVAFADLCFHLIDNVRGIAGVEEEEVALLTNKFFRGTRNTEGKEGSGLGLYISSELMKKMGGQLICEGEKDGFSVILMIPLA